MSHEPGGGKPLDRAVHRTLASQSRGHGLVESTTVTGDGLVVRLDTDRYPGVVESARLDVRWYRNGDYSVHYVESRPDDDPADWSCRWDRHPNPHNERAHFHTPPAAGDPVVDDTDAPTHPTDVLFRALDWTEGRVDDLWE